MDVAHLRTQTHSGI